MEDLEQKATWVLILFPGVISMGIVAQIVSLGEVNETEVFFICVFFTVIDVAIALILSRVALVCASEQQKQRLSKPVFAGMVLAVSIFVGVTAGLAAEGDVFFKALRWFPVTSTLNKRSNSGPLAFLLSQNSARALKQEGDARPDSDKVTEAFVRIKLKSGGIYEGWPEFYGTSEGHEQIYLSPACTTEKDGGAHASTKVRGPGIVLFESEIESIEFVDRQASPCFKDWYGTGGSPQPPPAGQPSSSGKN